MDRRVIASARDNAAVWVLALALCFTLKQHYSEASPEGLRWVLAGPAWLVGVLLDTHFEFERHVGYVSLEARTAIVPACAGLNFMIMVFGMLGTAFAPRFASQRGKLTWLGAALALAYLCTLLVNSFRITTGILLSTHALPFDGAEVHRDMGVLVYLGALVALYWMVDRALPYCLEERACSSAIRC